MKYSGAIYLIFNTEEVVISLYARMKVKEHGEKSGTECLSITQKCLQLEKQQDEPIYQEAISLVQNPISVQY